MKRALIITYYWPPTGGSGVQRWLKFSKYLPEMGWQPVIYTPENPERLVTDESLVAEIPAEAEVIKTHITEPYSLARKLMGGGDGKGAGLNPINAQQKGFKQKAALWARSNFFVPDPRVWWVRPSVKYLKEYLKGHPVDVIVSTGPPQSMHLIGLNLHRATGIPWVADFRDAWTKIFYFKHLSLTPKAARLHHQQEKAVLDGATRVVSVSPMELEDLRGMSKTPMSLITNGFDEQDFAGPEPPQHPGEFRIVNAGLFSSDGNPLALWDTLKKKCDSSPGFKAALRIRLAGKVDAEVLEAIRERGLGENLQYLGYLSHAESVKELRAADMLLLLLRREPEYARAVPGKTFEYLAARKPVLGIGQEYSASAKMIADAGAGRMFDWDKGEEMGDFIDSVRSGAFSPKGEGIGQYSRRNCAAAMVELFESII